MHDSVPCANGFWHRNFGLEKDKHIIMAIALSFIYPTNILLCKMKARHDQLCSYCNDVVDYIEHFLFDCPTLKKKKLKKWNYIEQCILITFHMQTHLTVDVLFKIKQHSCWKVKTKQTNH